MTIQTEPEPAVFVMELYLDPNGEPLGYLGRGSDYWATVHDKKSAAVTLIKYEYKNIVYYREADDDNSYMSVNKNAYVGFYAWIGATVFTHDEYGQVVSHYNDQKLSYNNDEYLYCWNAYKVLVVKFVDP